MPSEFLMMPPTICSDDSFLFNISVSRAKNLGVRSRAFMIILFEMLILGENEQTKKIMQIFPARKDDILYTDGQKKHYSKILSCIACGSQTRAA